MMGVTSHLMPQDWHQVCHWFLWQNITKHHSKSSPWRGDASVTDVAKHLWWVLLEGWLVLLQHGHGLRGSLGRGEASVVLMGAIRSWQHLE